MTAALVELTALVARAGGGHSFDGGGGSSGGGGLSSGGGGGFLFFGGGGGGTGGGIAVIIFFVLLLVVLRISWPRIRARRGGSTWTPKNSRSSGGYGAAGSSGGDGGGAPASAPPADGDWTHSDRPAIDSVRGDLFPGSAPAPASRESAADGLAAIAAHDPGFNQESFLESVQRTFFIVQEAWSQRKPEMSRQVMADGLWQQHRVQIQGYLDTNKRNVLEDLTVGDLTVIAAHRDQSYDTITVRVRAACADYDVEDGSGRTIRGDRRVHQWSEDWTFQRAASATTPTGGGTLSARCPNCGAPLDLDLSGECKYCKAPVSSGSYDWVLARIAQVPSGY